MARRCLVCLTMAIALMGFVQASAGAASTRFVIRSGTQLYLDGRPYRFTGLNVYNANSAGSCWYAMSSGPILNESLAAMGPGIEAMRAWFFQSLATTNGRRDWSAFDHTLAVARARGMKVIPTLTNQWGDCEAGGYKTDRWYTDGFRQRDPAGTVSYLRWVAEVVARYRNDPTILAWQLINEAEVKPSVDAPTCSINAARTLKRWAAETSLVVKLIDRRHLLSLGTIGGGQCGTQEAEYQDVHRLPTIDLCEVHDYQPAAPIPGDQFNGMQVRLDQCRALNKPLFVGEMGIRPTDVGGTPDDPAAALAARAAAFDVKLDAQFPAGVTGVLAWAWSALGSTTDNYDIGPTDPTLTVLGRY
jgi:hypothetical protein